MWKIPLFDLNYDENESKAVQDVLDSKWLSSGPKVEEFENKFANYLGSEVKCSAVSSCTAALHMALLLNNIKAGDEVIISGLTFIAALNVISIVGATPVLADCKSLDDWNVSVKDIESKITGKTKAVIIVHYAGYPCDMEEIVELTKRRNLILIEDAAHAPGAEYKGQKCGTFGDIACFSFFSNKNLSTGEGGMFVTKDKEIDKQVKLLRSHGMTSMTIDRHQGKAISYDVVRLGLNYRMDEIRAALGIIQLSKLDKSNEVRKKLVEKYINSLASIKGIIIPWENPSNDKMSSYHIFPILLPKNADRIKIIDYLKEKGIQTSIHYPAFQEFSYYKQLINSNVQIANEISERVLTLPLYPTMNNENVEFVCAALKKYLCQK